MFACCITQSDFRPRGHPKARLSADRLGRKVQLIIGLEEDKDISLVPPKMRVNGVSWFSWNSNCGYPHSVEMLDGSILTAYTTRRYPGDRDIADELFSEAVRWHLDDTQN